VKINMTRDEWKPTNISGTFGWIVSKGYYEVGMLKSDFLGIRLTKQKIDFYSITEF